MPETFNFAEILEIKEPLDPELKEYLVPSRLTPKGKMLHHPLMIEILPTPMLYAFYNRRFKYLKEAVAEAKEKKKWHTYVFLHERPYRVTAFLDAVAHGLKSRDYWELVAEVWIDSENIHQHKEFWEELWWDGVPRRAKKWLMSDDELTKLDSLPKEVVVYRGTEYRENVEGLSWTLDKNKAIWFANRFRRPGSRAYLVTGKVKKSDIKALFLGRGEDEIISDLVTIQKIQELEDTKRKREKESAIG